MVAVSVYSPSVPVSLMMFWQKIECLEVHRQRHSLTELILLTISDQISCQCDKEENTGFSMEVGGNYDAGSKYLEWVEH